ncbi:type 1 fimbrial protein, partial [Escherichia coli]
MFKGQKALVALDVYPLFTDTVYVADGTSGEINLKAALIESPCRIHKNNIDKEVELGKVMTRHINQEH